MQKDMVVEVEKRTDTGKNESRRLRRAGKVPGVLYGGAGGPVPVVIDPRSLERILTSESGENTLFGLEVRPGGAVKGKVMIKDRQLDPVTDRIVHADLMLIAMDKAIRVQVAIHPVGVARGVKLQGGILDHPLREVEVECLPAEIPERIDVDISELDMGKSYRVSDLKAPAGVKILTDAGTPVISVVAPTVEKVEAPVVEGAPAVEAPAEPEVIRKGKAETAEEEAAAPEKEKRGGDKGAEKGGKGEKK